MSKDLLDAFANPGSEEAGIWGPQSDGRNDALAFSGLVDAGEASNPWESESGNLFRPPQPSTIKHPGLVEGLDEEWGDFEGAQSSNAARKSTSPQQSTQSKYQYSLDELRSTTTPVSLRHGSTVERNQIPRRESSGYKTKAKDPNVLFDVSDHSEEGVTDDEFGEFAGAGTAQSVGKAGTVDLLRLDDDNDEETRSMGLHSRSFGQVVAKEPVPKAETTIQSVENLFSSLDIGIEPHRQTSKAVKPAQKAKTTKPSTTSASVEDESWDDFTPWDTNVKEDQDTISFQKSPTTPDHLLNASPPTNIPQPATLLSLFPTIFENADKVLKAKIASEGPDSERLRYLRSYLAISSVCGRIMSGRKLRWKRDTLLSQSMRIGPASSGKLSGMKVASIDKAEVAKEDREVAELLRTWQRQIGRLRSAVVEAKKHSSEIGTIPELRENIPIQTVKQVHGGVPSRTPCAICGLKRDERCVKVDFDVLDSFGEWWIEGANAHKACLVFWNGYKDELRQR